MNERIESRVDESVSMPDFPEPFSTVNLPDEVVNQRLVLQVQVTSEGDRKGKWMVVVWIDQTQGTDGWVEMPPESYRGADGEGLTPDEARYAAASLYAAAQRLVHAAGGAQ